MRDRLLEILRSERQPWTYLLCKSNIEALADYLLNNGVVVLPCEIGEKLYDCGEFFCEDCSCPEIYELEDDEMTIHKRPHDYGYRFTYDGMYIGHEDIGNHIFRTREEAEAALKGVNYESSKAD